MEGRAKMIQGNPFYPTNQGKIHARCESGLQALYHPDRISSPMRRTGPRESAEFSAISWQPNAMDALRTALQERGRSSVMITEPLRGHMALLVDRFSTAIGAEHLGFEAIDNNTYRAAVNNVFGQDSMPDFDLDNAAFICPSARTSYPPGSHPPVIYGATVSSGRVTTVTEGCSIR